MNVPFLEQMDIHADDFDGSGELSNISGIQVPNNLLNSTPLSADIQELSTSFERGFHLRGSFKSASGYSHDSGKANDNQDVTTPSLRSGSSRNRHTSEPGGFCVTIFDMRAADWSSGEMSYFDVQRQLIPQKIATQYSVEESLLVCLKSAINEEKNTTVIAITNSPREQILFIRWDDFPGVKHKCVKVSYDATPTTVARDLDNINISYNSKSTYESYWPFCSHQKLYREMKFIEQGILSGYEICFRPIRPVSLKCLYRPSPKIDIIYYIDCQTTDCIEEIKQKIFDELKNSTNTHVSSLDSPRCIWLTTGNRLYRNREYIGSPSPSDINNISSGLSDFVDCIIHIVPNADNCLAFNVLHGETAIDKMVISADASSAQLRYKISSLLHCPPNAIKLTLNRQRLPEKDNIQDFEDFKLNCTISASIRHEITVIVHVTIDDQKYNIQALKLDQVLTIKQKLAGKIHKPVKQIKLLFEGKEPNDYHLLEQVHIKDRSEVKAIWLPNRILVSIRKNRRDPITVVIEDSSKFKVKDLKTFYTNTIKLKSKYDVNFHSFKHVIQIEDSMCLLDVGIDDGCKIYATEKPSFRNTGAVITIFDYREDRQIHIRYGTIIKGRLFLEASDLHGSEESSVEFESPKPQREIRGIRLAYPEEIEALCYHIISSSNQSSPETSQQIVPLKLNIPKPIFPTTMVPDGAFSAESPSTWPIYEGFPLMSHSNTQPNLREPYGVVSDPDLDKLVKLLPANGWQPLMRSLLPDAEITKIIESNRTNVEEQIFRCLNKWKQKEAVKATKNVLKKALKDHDLNLICEQLFGQEVESE